MKTNKKKRIKSKEKVALILSKFPEAKSNYKLLMLLYWTLIDNIDIPKEVMLSILGKGTEPETINRAKRKIVEQDMHNIVNDFNEYINSLGGRD